MRGHEDEVTTAVFTRDGSQVLSSSADGTLRLWDARTAPRSRCFSPVRASRPTSR